MKTINYRGMTFEVEDHFKYITTDAYDMWVAGGKNCGRVGNNPNIKNWRRSLREC